MTDSIYANDNWRVAVGEISTARLFRIERGNGAVVDTFPYAQLGDLITVLTTALAAANPSLSQGTYFQARRRVLPDEVAIEPFSNTYPPAYFQAPFSTVSDLVSVLSQAQADTATGDDGDWDITETSIRALSKSMTSVLEDPTSAFAAELNASLGGQVNGFGDFYGKAVTQQQDINLLIVGDSTLDLANVGSPAGTACSWALGLAAEIGALFPTHTVEQRRLNLAGNADAWSAATSIQTGTGYRSDLAGPKKITVWVAGWSGRNWPDFFDTIRRDVIFVTPAADVIVFGFGHNDPDAPVESIRGRVSICVERARVLNPRAQIILSAQNPRSASPGRAETRSDIYRGLARERGWGFLNVTQAFHDDGRSLTPGGPLIDSIGTHPTTDGASIWRGVFMAQLRGGREVAPIPTSAPTLTLSTPSIAAPLPEWRKSNLSDGVAVTPADGGNAITRAAKVAGAAASFYEWTTDVVPLRGQVVTFVERFNIPAGVDASAGQLQILSSSAGLLAYTIAEYGLRDVWFDVAVSALVPLTATGTLQFRVYVDPTTAGTTPAMFVREPAVFRGAAPYAQAPRVLDTEALAKRASLQALVTVNALTTVMNSFPNASAERDLLPLVGLTTGTTVARSTAWAETGSCSYEVSASTTTLQDDVVGLATSRAAVAAPGEVWRVSAVLKNPAGGSRLLRTGLRFLNAAGGVLADYYYSSTIAAGATNRVSGSNAAPANTASVVALFARPNTGAAALADKFGIDDVILTAAAALPTAPANADTDPKFYYAGAIGSSASVGIV